MAESPSKIQASIYNLFDEPYEDPDSSGPQELTPGDLPKEGISTHLNVGYKF